MATFLIPGTIFSFTLGVSFFLVATYFLVYYLVYLRQTNSWTQSNIPFLQPTFLLGHKYFLNLGKCALAVPMDQMYKENAEKDLFGVFLGTIPIIVLKDRKIIRDISVKYSSQTFATGLSTPESEVEAQYMINSTIDEEKWKFSRTALSPVFSSSWFQGPGFDRIKHEIHELWRSAEKTESNGSPMNVTTATEEATLNILASNFGIDSHSHEMNDLRNITTETFDPSFHKFMTFFVNFFVPSLQKFEYFKLVPRRICTIFSKILKHQMNQRDQTNTERRDFIDLLRSLRVKQESNNSYDKSSDMFLISEEVTQRQMTGLGLIFLAGGSETVYKLLGFTVHALSLYPEYQGRIRGEVYEALKKHGVSEFNYEVVRTLSFTFQCVFEASRLFPPGYLLRQCLEEFNIKGTTYIIRKGDRLLMSLYSLNRDEALFNDPHSFVPERFALKDSNLTVPGSILTFGTGPRKCPGYQHGVFVCAAILAALLYKYEIKPHSHPKLMVASDFHPQGFLVSPRKDILVNLIRWEH